MTGIAKKCCMAEESSAWRSMAADVL